MHVLCRDGYADRAYLAALHDARASSRSTCGPAILRGRPPSRAFRDESRGLRAARRGAQAHVLPPRLRLLAPAARRREHACRVRIAAVTAPGSTRRGAFHNNGAIYHWRKELIEGLDVRDPKCACSTRSRSPHPDRRRRGAARRPARHGHADPEHQSGVRRPEQELVKRGFARARTCSPASTSSS
jgi:hypothetical protein